MEKTRIIKKYPNRRLYDMETSKYTTLDEIKQLVLTQVMFRVIETGTEEDVTNYILLQIINENETGKTPIFTTEILKNIICFYGNPLQNMMSDFLENCFSAVTEQKMGFGNYFKNMMEDKNPFNKLADIAKQNFAMWQSMQNTTSDGTDKKSKVSNKIKDKKRPRAKK
jgi:polyhydroxyalkanoate synthesis repressor PhaR